MPITWRNVNTPGFGSAVQQSAAGTNTFNKGISNLAGIATTFQNQALAAEKTAREAPQVAFDLNQKQLANQAILTRQANDPARANINNLIASGDLDAASAAIDEFEGADTAGFSRGIAVQEATDLAASNALADRGFAAQARGRQATTFANQQQDRATALAEKERAKGVSDQLAAIMNSGVSREAMQKAGQEAILRGGGSPQQLDNFNRSLISGRDTADLRTQAEQTQITNTQALADQTAANNLTRAKDKLDAVRAANPEDPVVQADRAAVQLTDVKIVAQGLAGKSSWWRGGIGVKSGQGLIEYIDDIAQISWIVDKKEGVRKANKAEVKAGNGFKAKPWMLTDALITATDTDKENWAFSPSTNVNRFEKTLGRLATDTTSARRTSANEQALEEFREFEKAQTVTSGLNRSNIPENIIRR